MTRCRTIPTRRFVTGRCQGVVALTRRVRLVVSGVLALAAAMACVLYGEQTRQEAERLRAEAMERYGGEVVTLVVATERIAAGEAVDRRNVSERDWLADLAPEGAVTGIDEVLGAEVTVPVAAGAPLTALNFMTDADAVEVPSGYVALSVPVTDKLGLPSSVSSGTVLAAYEVLDTGTRVISGRVQVLRATGEGGGSLGSAGPITVAVAAGDVSGFLDASAEGTLRLALPAEDVLESLTDVERAPTEVVAVTEGPEDENGDE